MRNGWRKRAWCARLLCWSVLLLTLVLPRRSLAQPTRVPATEYVVSEVTLEALPGDEPLYVCFLSDAPPEPAAAREAARTSPTATTRGDAPPRLVGDWEARLERYLRASLSSDGPRPTPPALSEHPAQPGSDIADSVAALVNLNRPVVAPAACLHRPSHPPHDAPSDARTQTANAQPRPGPAISCTRNMRVPASPVGPRVLLLENISSTETDPAVQFALAGNILTVRWRAERYHPPTLHVRGGNYLAETSVQLDTRATGHALQLLPSCVVRDVAVPVAALQAPTQVRVAVGFDKLRFDTLGPLESPHLRLAVPTRLPSDATENTLCVALYQPGPQTVQTVEAPHEDCGAGSLDRLQQMHVVATLWGRWVSPSPPLDLPQHIRSITFSWRNDTEYAPALRCPTATIDLLNIACAPVTIAGGQDPRPCRYWCDLRTVDHTAEVQLPLRIRLESPETRDRWFDTLQVIEQCLDAPPDFATRHLVGDIRWPDDLRTSDEIAEVTVLSETDQVYHLFPRRDGQRWLLVVPGARDQTPLRLIPYGAHAFFCDEPTLVSGGMIRIPSPAERITPVTFGLRVGPEILGPMPADPRLPWTVGGHLQATLRFIAPFAHYTGRFITFDVSAHYLLAPVAYIPIQTDTYRVGARPERAWYNRLGVSATVLFPIFSSRVHLGPMVTWLYGWPILGSDPGVGRLEHFWSLGLAARLNFTRHWSIEVDGGWQLVPLAQFENGRFDGDPLVKVDWRSGLNFRGGLRYWF